MFADLGAVPSTMSACRAVLACYALTRDAVLLQSDCVKAYIQADMKGVPTYVRLPKAWWPKGWETKYRDPLCKLIKAIYGHPDSGNHWAEKIGAELSSLGGKEISGWSAVYVFNPAETHVAVFVIYVDDLVIYGTNRVNKIVKKLRKTIKMEDPTSLQKYVGCVHKVIRNEVHGEEITHITFDMEAYFRSAIEDYVEYTGAVLSKVGSPFAPKPATEELDNLLARPGEQGSKAASFIMKLMYGSRMALPSISVIIGRLSRLITKWTADADRRLLRVYQYLN